MSTAPEQRPANPKLSAETKAIVPVGVLIAVLLSFCVWIHNRTAAVEISIARIETKVDILMARTGASVSVSSNDPKVAANNGNSNRNP